MVIKSMLYVLQVQFQRDIDFVHWCTPTAPHRMEANKPSLPGIRTALLDTGTASVVFRSTREQPKFVMWSTNYNESLPTL